MVSPSPENGNGDDGTPHPQTNNQDSSGVSEEGRLVPNPSTASSDPVDTRTVVLKRKLFKTPKERSLQAAENERRIQVAGDIFRQSLLIQPSTQVTPQAAASVTAAQSNDDRDVEIIETGHHSAPIEVESETDDTSTAAQFNSCKRTYERKTKKGQNTFEDDIAFSKASHAEQKRLKLQSRKRAFIDLEEDDDEELLFLPEGTPLPVDASAQSGDLQDVTASKKRKSRRPNVIPEVALQDATEIGRKALEAEERKALSKKRRPKGAAKKKIPKDPKSHTLRSNKKQQFDGMASLKHGRRRRGPEMLNMQTLFNNDIVSAAQANVGKEAQPGFTSTIKKNALAELIASIPEAERTTHNADKNALDKATKSFTGQAAMKADGNNGWRLRGMRTSLYHYQLLGAAFMRDRENSATRPYGGLQSDEMGLGKTVTCIANIIDGQAPANSPNRTTLIVCPAGLCSQWLSEIKKHVLPATFQEVMIYRAGARIESADPTRTLSSADVIITSYNEVLRSYPHCKAPMHLVTPEAKAQWWSAYFNAERGLLHRIFFRRIVLDEGEFNCALGYKMIC